MFHELPLPTHFDATRINAVWRVPYQERAAQARAWATQHQIQPAVNDSFRICLIVVDLQNTFCLPDFELYVGGRSGTGALDDTRRLCEFIYRNLAHITQIVPTLDTHQAAQIFHALFWVNARGEHPTPFTAITAEQVQRGEWRINPAMAAALGISVAEGQRHLEHYTRQLEQSGKYALTIWPYHAMLGGIGHALVSAFEEAMFFHSIARYSQPDFHIKGNAPLTEHYSVLGPEVQVGYDGKPLALKDEKIVNQLETFDAVIIAGEAKSHCVAWTIADLLDDLRTRDEKLARKVYLLEDCTSPVVVPGAIDYTAEADAAFQRFADAGMHLVRSTDPLVTWQGVRL